MARIARLAPVGATLSSVSNAAPATIGTMRRSVRTRRHRGKSSEAEKCLPRAVANLREPWEAETTARNLALIRDARLGRTGRGADRGDHCNAGGARRGLKQLFGGLSDGSMRTMAHDIFPAVRPKAGRRRTRLAVSRRPHQAAARSAALT